jgi:hypothetical protein
MAVSNGLVIVPLVKVSTDNMVSAHECWLGTTIGDVWQYIKQEVLK